MATNPRGLVRPDHPDVFISYAKVDDRKPPGVEHGWVTTLVMYLKDLLAQKLGRRESFWLWWDHQIPRDLPLTPEIEARVRETSVLVIVLSQGYLSSPWCEKERTLFLSEVRRRVADGGRVFVVRYDPLGQEECPEELRDLIGHSFCTSDDVNEEQWLPLGYPCPTPQDKEYYARANTLAGALAKELRRLTEASTAIQSFFAPAVTVPTPAQNFVAPTVTVPAPPTSHPFGSIAGVVKAPESRDEIRPAVYLAEVPDALDGLREEVKSYLESERLRVLPEIEYCRNEAAVNAALDEAVLFVQLLNDAPGKRLLKSKWSCVGLQNSCARRHKIPVLQWRDRKIDLTAVADLEHRKLLDDPSVVVEDLLDFKRHIVRRVQEILLPPPSPRLPGVEQVVFIDAKGTEYDADLSQQVSDVLFSAGLGSISSLIGAEPLLADQFLEEALGDCAGLLLIHGSDPLWLAKELLKIRKLLARFERLKLGLCDGPPLNKPRCNVRIGQHSIDCRAGVRGEGFTDFIAACKRGSAP
jgi:hypothetical protein